MSKKEYRVFQKPPIEESYDFAEQVRRQIERCLEASAIQETELRDGTYKACILALGNLVPLDDRDEDYLKAIDACTVEKEKWRYRKRGRVRVGTEEKPIHGSPRLVTYLETNWDEYFTVLFNKFVELKVTVRRGTYAG